MSVAEIVLSSAGDNAVCASTEEKCINIHIHVHVSTEHGALKVLLLYCFAGTNLGVQGAGAARYVQCTTYTFVLVMYESCRFKCTCAWKICV